MSVESSPKQNKCLGAQEQVESALATLESLHSGCGDMVCYKMCCPELLFEIPLNIAGSITNSICEKRVCVEKRD